MGQLDLVGGITFLGEVSTEVPTAVHVEYYARIVERTATRRRLIETGGKIVALGYEESEEVEASLAQAEAELAAVSAHRGLQTYVSVGHVINTLFNQIEKAQEHHGERTGLATGYNELDDLTGGLQKSDLIILAARPSVGKSALAMSLAYNAAKHAHAPVAVFSLEMSREQLTQRLVAMHTGIAMQHLRNGSLTSAELHRVFDGMGVISELPIYIEDTAGLSIAELRAKARRMHAEIGLQLLVIDYLQLMAGAGGKGQNREQEVSEISRGLKALARELNIPLIALSQLSRAVEGRASHIPMLSDLRESGSLEQDADIVWFIYREELYDRETNKKGIAEIHMAKHRNGPLGIVPLRFEARTTRFENPGLYDSPAGF
jgi:replicative DNA helicase